jgi:alkanesulfonate monooxygenase SsuD/methylene tetrahydromethanopterin reductase-like flavin-dependent oxidoreductase (luciferase family)
VGKQVSLVGAQLRPRPVQRPQPPVWIGGSGRRRTLPLVARYADVWHSNTHVDYADLSAELDRLAIEAGRDPRSIRRAASLSLSENWDEVEANALQMRDSGVSYLVCGWPGEGRARVEEFWTRIGAGLLGG